MGFESRAISARVLGKLLLFLVKHVIKRNITTLNNHIPHSAQFHNIKHIFLHIFMYMYEQEVIFNVYNTAILIPILTTK